MTNRPLMRLELAAFIGLAAAAAYACQDRRRDRYPVLIIARLGDTVDGQGSPAREVTAVAPVHALRRLATDSARAQVAGLVIPHEAERHRR
jgi:hypothetical protein